MCVIFFLQLYFLQFSNDFSIDRKRVHVFFIYCHCLCILGSLLFSEN